jgi:hypothetical protein
MNSVLRSMFLLILFMSVVVLGQDNAVRLISFGPNQEKNIPDGVQYVNYALADNGSTSGNSRAPQGTQRYIRTVYLITQSELAASGVPANVNFTSIGFVYSAAQNVPTTGSFKVYFQNTANTTYSKPSNVWSNGTDGVIDEMTAVDSGSLTIPAATGGFDYTLSNPGAFTYTGGGIYVAFEYQNPSGTVATTANVALCTNVLAGSLKNAFSTTTLPTSVGATASAFRPGTRLGYVMANDAAAANLYTMGKLPKGFGTPYVISALLRNAGDEAIASLPCTLKVTGANSFTNIKTVSLPVGASLRVYFDGFTPLNTGVDTVNITIAGDPNTLNNSFTTRHTVNDTYTFAYSDGSNTFSSALGYNPNVAGSFVSKYYVNGHSKLNSSKVFIYGGVGKTIRGIAYNKAGTIIGQTTDYTILQSDSLNYVTFNFDNQPEVTNDSVYVGVWVNASATSFYPMGLQRELPTRSGAFFLVSSAAVFTDAAQYGYGKFMLEAQFSQNISGEILASETFNTYTNGNLAGQNGWVKFGSGPEPVVANTDTLHYPGYEFNGGSYINFPVNSSTTSRVYKDFADTTYSMTSPGTVAYLSLLLKLDTTYTTANQYFFSLGSAPGTSNYYAKLFAQKITDSTFYLGVSKTSNTAAFSSKVLRTGQTHLVVVRYNVNNTALNQTGNTCYMWINPISGNEPDTALADAKVYAGQGDFGSAHISSVMWHNRGVNNPKGSIDGIRLAVSSNSSEAAWIALAPGNVPVELTSFTSTVSNGKIVLLWSTATETNNSGFEVERKEGNSWTTLGFVKGSGSSTSSKSYSFTDESVNSGRFSYRLKQIDFDGTYTYSNVVNAEIGQPNSFMLSQNYPNPFNPSTKIDYQVPAESRVKIEMYNVTGEKIAELIDTDHAAGFYSLNVNTSLFKNISSGVYIYKMSATEKASGKSFINTKKMMLMK